tara:strand:- start:72 stop:218 length:147 start_codon:yes stop_codon:yes gene_type:complete
MDENAYVSILERNPAFGRGPQAGFPSLMLLRLRFAAFIWRREIKECCV